jgi:ubiquinol-cytochrome c reductase cytochrome b subunit
MIFPLSLKNSNIKSFSTINTINTFYTINNKKLKSIERIGPHNIDIISIIMGSTLGETHLEKRNKGIGTRIKFEQSNKNVEYLMWFHNYLASRGYCNNQIPKLDIRIKQKGEVFYHYRINSYTYSSFNWIHEMFYKVVDNKFIKIVPLNIEKYLTPLALAIWFMDDGSNLGKSARIATNCFTYEEICFLCEVLKRKYNITATPNKSGKNKGFIIYIHVNSMFLFSKLIKPYMLPSLYYKLGDY